MMFAESQIVYASRIPPRPIGGSWSITGTSISQKYPTLEFRKPGTLERRGVKLQWNGIEWIGMERHATEWNGIVWNEMK